MGLAILMGQLNFGSFSDAMELKLTRIYDNVPYDETLTARWGTACLVEGLEETILLDTGGIGSVLLSNMKKLGIDPVAIDVVVLSHIHSDHTGGMESLISANDHLSVYLPASFPKRMKQRIALCGVKVIEVDGPVKICKGAFSTGEMGRLFKEQALIVDSEAGPVVITGCSHPGVENFIRRAREITGGQVYFVTGGFHLGLSSAGRIQKTIDQLKRMGVKKVGPTHCTGKRAMKMFRDAWGDDFVDMGCGARFHIPQSQQTDRQNKEKHMVESQKQQ